MLAPAHNEGVYGNQAGHGGQSYGGSSWSGSYGGENSFGFKSKHG